MNQNFVKDRLGALNNWIVESYHHLNSLGNLSVDELNHHTETHYSKLKEYSTDLSLMYSEINEADIQHLNHTILQMESRQLLREAPICNHIIHKPRGYAGDAMVMKYMYENKYEGETNFGRVFHKVACQFETSETVRRRSKLIYTMFENLQVSDCLNLAAGPAYEIKEYLLANPGRKVNFTALDHDLDTIKESLRNFDDNRLSYGLANAFHLIKNRTKYLIPRKSLISFANPKFDSQGFRRLLLPIKYEIKKLKKENYDFVYTIGLYDYILTFPERDKGAVKLTEVLFSLVKPGGSLVIGNFSFNAPSWIRWIMTYFGTWPLIYRTESDMHEFYSSIQKEL